MSLFDVVAGLVLIVSGLIAFIRGATREVTTVLAFIAAIFVAVYGLRFSGPIARHAIHTAWIANTAAVLLLFVFAYILFRVIGGALTQKVRQTALSGLDRLLGLGIGLVRGAVVVGAFTLLINAATPPERMPAWIKDAKLYPAASGVASILRSVAPEGLRMAHTVEPSMRDAVKAGTTDAGADSAADEDQSAADSATTETAAKPHHGKRPRSTPDDLQERER
ncbi:CvpA family protein [Caulobacter sp. KR2-114]|uniref:CvpA family protein n=1 Tax=Caulobacter sp. KR2-114 TaxID=3400912 RepID=UPI003BFFB581